MSRVVSIPLADVLTVTTKRLLSWRGMEGVYDTLNLLTGDNLFTHQLPRAREWAAPMLLRQRPDLDVECPSFTGDESVRAFVKDMEAKYGLTVDVDLDDFTGWTQMDPIAELKAMMAPVDA